MKFRATKRRAEWIYGTAPRLKLCVVANFMPLRFTSGRPSSIHTEYDVSLDVASNKLSSSEKRTSIGWSYSTYLSPYKDVVSKE